jgi:hypothetical protein
LLARFLLDLSSLQRCYFSLQRIHPVEQLLDDLIFVIRNLRGDGKPSRSRREGFQQEYERQSQAPTHDALIGQFSSKICFT